MHIYNNHKRYHKFCIKYYGEGLSTAEGGSATDRSKAVVMVLFLFCMALWVLLRGVSLFLVLEFVSVLIDNTGTPEPCHEKTCLWGFRQGKTQTGLLSHRD